MRIVKHFVHIQHDSVLSRPLRTSRAAPAEHCQEFAEDHRGSAPNLGAVDDKRRHVERLTAALEGAMGERGGIHQRLNRNFQQPSDLSVGGMEIWARVRQRDEGVEPESADRDVNRGKVAHDSDNRGVEPDLFAGFPDGRLHERLAGIDRTAGQRDLTFVTTECVGAYRQQQRRPIVHWINERQTGGMTDACGIEVRRPLATRPRGEPVLRCDAWQWARQADDQPAFQFGEEHRKVGK